MHNTRERERQGRLGMRFYELSEYGIIGSLDTKRERKNVKRFLFRGMVKGLNLQGSIMKCRSEYELYIPIN